MIENMNGGFLPRTRPVRNPAIAQSADDLRGSHPLQRGLRRNCNFSASLHTGTTSGFARAGAEGKQRSLIPQRSR